MSDLEYNYLRKLISVIDTPDVKVVTGIRRCGKSVLLMQLMEYINKKIDCANIIFIDLRSPKGFQYLDYRKLYSYIEECYDETKKNYVCIDEIQLCRDFEIAINAMHLSMKYDIYISGSISFMQSQYFATYNVI